MSKTLVFIPTAFHFEHFKRLSPRWNELTVITHDFNCGSLAKDFTDVIYLTSFLSEQELNENVRKVLEIRKFWETSWQENCVHRGISLVEMSVYDHYFALLSSLNLNLSVQRLLDALDPSEIILFQEFFKPDFCGLPNTYFPDCFNGVWAWHASQRKIKLRLLPGVDFTDDHSSLILHLIQENTAHFTQQPLSFKPKGLQELPFSNLKQFKRRVFLIGYFMEMYDQWALFQHLQADPDTLFVFVCLQNTPLLELGPSSLFLDCRLIKHWPLDLNPVYQTIEQERKLFFQGETSLHQQYPEIFHNHFLDFQFHFFFDSLKNNARTIETMHVLNQSFQPDLVIAGGSSSLGGVRAAVETFNHLQVPTVGFMHGGAWLTFYMERTPYPFQYFAVRGEKHLEKMAKHMPSMKGSCVGDLREHVQSLKSNPKIQSALTRYFLPHDKRPAILFITGNFMVGFAETLTNPVLHEKTWEFLVDLANRHKDLRFFIKPHPGYDFFHYYEQICHPASEIILLERSIPITEYLTNIDIVVAVNFYTSAMVEVALMGKPLIYLHEACYKSSFFHIEEAQPLVIQSAKDLEATLERIQTDPSFRQEFLDHAQELLQGITSYTGEVALKKALALLDNIIETKPVAHDQQEEIFVPFLVELALRHLNYLQTGDQAPFQELLHQIHYANWPESEKTSLLNYINNLRVSLGC